MATRVFGPSKGNRRPTVAIPGSKGSGRPTAQRGGGGNKAAGSVEPTAANTPTVTVHSDGSVTAEHFSPSRAGRAAAEAAVQRQRAAAKRVVALVESKPKSEPVEAKGTKAPRTPGPHIETRPAISGGTKPERTELAKAIGVGPTTPGGKERRVNVAAHTRKAPKATKLAGTQGERKKARENLRQAKKTVRESKPRLEAPLGPEQKRFVLGVAKRTHLSPKTIAAQAIAEEGSGAQTEAEQTHNFLNMGPGISYSSLREGIGATAKNYNTGPYEGVRATRGKAPAVQAKAIAESPWGTGPLVEQTLSQVHLTPGNPKAVKDLRAAEKEAKALGLKIGGKGPGKPPKQVVTRYKAARSAMNELDARNNRGEQPYVWGGGHGTNPIGGADCSGSVSYVLVKTHVLKPGESLVSGDMGSVLAPGPGALTVFYNADHTFIYDAVKHEFWGTSESNSGGGAGYFPTSVGKSEVASGNSAGAYQVGHIPGLGKKQALQMGGSVGGLTSSTESFPGMTLSSGGTSATIDSGAGTTVSKPGFSKRPIQVSPFDAEATLAQGELKAGKQASGPSTAVLDALERKYGAAA